MLYTIVERGHFLPFAFSRIENIALLHATLAVPATDAIYFSAQITDTLDTETMQIVDTLIFLQIYFRGHTNIRTSRF